MDATNNRFYRTKQRFAAAPERYGKFLFGNWRRAAITQGAFVMFNIAMALASNNSIAFASWFCAGFGCCALSYVLMIQRRREKELELEHPPSEPYEFTADERAQIERCFYAMFVEARRRAVADGIISPDFDVRIDPPTRH